MTVKHHALQNQMLQTRISNRNKLIHQPEKEVIHPDCSFEFD